MPSSSQFFQRGHGFHKIHKFIPQKWKQKGRLLDQQQNHPLNSNNCPIEAHPNANGSMIDCFLISLKNFVRQGNLREAFRTFSVVQLHVSNHGFSDHTLHSISALLLPCTNLKVLQEGQQLHAHIIMFGVEQHPVLVRRLVAFYSAFDLLINAHTIASNSNILHPLPWNLLISAYVRNGLHENALSVYKEMLGRGITPDNFTYPSVLKACGENMEIDLGREVHRSINAIQARNLVVQNALLSMYGKFGEVSVAHSIFDKMAERDPVSWNSMISAYASKGMWKHAFQLFESMRAEGVESNIITWNTITGGCLQVGNYVEALHLISQMGNTGITLDHVATLIGLGACSHLGSIKLGKEIHGSAIRRYYHGLNKVINALITMYSRCKDIRHANILFRSTEKNIITWNSMISGYCHIDLFEEATFIFREMLVSGAEPNHVTVASILPLCARVANLQHGREFHCYIMRCQRFWAHLAIWNALVDMYARSGKVLQARKVFDMMEKKDEVTYTSLIAGYGLQGEGRVALSLFEEMISLQIKPDHVTMIAVLTACSHSGLVCHGERLFKRMQSDFGISPCLEHYACMVDMFGRAGLLYKAKEIITGMNCLPTPAMWATLLGACRVHRNVNLGEWAAGKLLETKPENAGYYVLAANMYAAGRCWNELVTVRTYMRDAGIKKDPGCAWIDVGNGFSSFLVDDTSNAHSEEIYSVLDGLTDVIKNDCCIASEFEELHCVDGYV